MLPDPENDELCIPLKQILQDENLTCDYNELEPREEFIWKGEEELFETEEFDCDVDDALYEMVSQRVKSEPVFKVIGEEKFIEPRRIRIRPAWVTAASLFQHEIINENCADLESIPGVNEKLAERMKTHIQSYFPVQKAVLSYLMPLSSGISVMPPRDVAVSAPTGSGKTLCYVLPILNGLQHCDPSNVYAVVVAPLVLLASQIYEEFIKYNVFGAKVVLLAGSQSYEHERRQLFPNGSNASQAAIIVATPERLIEHLTDVSGTINLNRLRYLVVDEADRMKNIARLEWLGLLEQRANVKANNTSLDRLHNLNNNRWLQKIIVSATLSYDVERLFMWNLRCPRLFCAGKEDAKEQQNDEQVENGESKASSAAKMAESISLPKTLIHRVVTCRLPRKPLEVCCWIRSNPSWKKIMIFVNNLVSASRLTFVLQHMFKGKFTVAEMTTNCYGARRQKVIKRFSSGAINILVCSDATGRGIDIPNVDLVINYEVPKNNRVFVHRAGRTARAGKEGTVITFVEKHERIVLKKILITYKLWDGTIEEEKQDLSTVHDRALYKKVLERLQKNVQG